MSRTERTRLESLLLVQVDQLRTEAAAERQRADIATGQATAARAMAADAYKLQGAVEAHAAEVLRLEAETEHLRACLRLQAERLAEVRLAVVPPVDSMDAMLTVHGLLLDVLPPGHRRLADDIAQPLFLKLKPWLRVRAVRRPHAEPNQDTRPHAA